MVLPHSVGRYSLDALTHWLSLIVTFNRLISRKGSWRRQGTPVPPGYTLFKPSSLSLIAECREADGSDAHIVVNALLCV
jgi:hypothetical protein